MKPVCVPCRRFFKAKKNGFYFIEGMPKVNDAKPGTAEPENWTPYKIWAGDLYECPGCGAQVISGVPSLHITEHYKPDFEDTRQRLNAGQFMVNDC